MASKSLGTLTVDLIAKVGGFVEGMDKAERAANKRAQGIDKAMTKMAKGAEQSLNAAAKAAGAIGVAAVAGSVALVKGAADSAREISTLSQVANTSAEQFQRWSAGAKTVGVEQEKLADILKDMSDRVGDFLSTGGGPMKDFFDNIAPQIGVTAEQFRKLSGPEALQLYVSSLEKANLSQNEMAFYMEAIASDSTKLLPLLKNNGAEIQRLGDNAERLGVVLSDIEVEQLAEVRRGLDDLGMVFEGLGNQVAMAALPHIRQFTDLMQDPQTVAGIQHIAQSILDVASAAIAGAAELANFSRWVGESLAAATQGVAADDVARLQGEADKIRELLGSWNPLKKTVLFGTGGVIEYWSEQELKDELAEIESAIAGATKNIAEAARSARLDKLLVPPELIHRASTLGTAYGKTGQQIVEANKKSAESEKAFIAEVAEGAKALARYREEIQGILDSLYPQAAAAKAAAAEYNALRGAVGQVAGVTDQTLSDWIDKNVAVEASIRQLADAYDPAMAAAALAAEETLRVWQEATNRIDEAFANAWAGAFDSFSDFADQIKAALRQLLGELAHMAITRPILVQMGLGGQQGPAAGLGNLLSLSGLTKFLQQNPFSGIEDSLTGSSALLSDLGMRIGDLSVMDIGLSALAGYAGNFLGGEIGQRLFGKEAESSIAAALGGAGGAILGGPIGAAIGSTLGAIVDALVGGDGYSRQAFGATVQPRETAGQSTGYATRGASGLDYVGLTEGSQDPAAANAFADVLAATDTAITNFVALFGAELDLAGQAIFNGAGTRWGQAFFGSLDGSGLDVALQDFENRFIARVEEVTGIALDLPLFRSLAVEGETLGDTLARVGAEFTTANSTLETLGLAVYELGLQGLAAADGLVQALGGLESFTAATAAYYQAFYSEEERLAAANGQLLATFASLGIQAPATNAEFRAIVESLDLTTTAGQATFAALMAIAPTFDAVTKATAAQAAAAAEAARAAQALAQAQDEQAQAAAAAALAARNSTLADIAGTILSQYQEREATLADLTGRLAGINAEIDGLTAGFDAVPDIINNAAASVDKLAFSSSQLRSVADNIKSVVASLSLSDISPLTNKQQLDFARQQFAQAQRDAAGGDASGIASAAQTYLQQASKYFASSPEYVAIFADVVGYLENMGVEIESDAERAERAEKAQQAALESINRVAEQSWAQQIDQNKLDQLIQEKQLVEQQIANLQAIDSLDVTKAQLNRLIDITDGIGSVAELLGSLPTDLADALGAILGVAITDYRALTPTEEFFGTAPQFSGGGIGTGPATGYQAILHGTEAVVPIPNGYIPVQIQNRGPSSDDVDQLRQQIGRIEALMVQAAGQRQQQISHTRELPRRLGEKLTPVKVLG